MSVEGEPQRLGAGGEGRWFYGLSVPSLTRWPENLILGSELFAALVVADGTAETTEELAYWARRALDQGLVYSSSWGPGCETVHDVVDWEELARHNYDTTGPVVMTASHERESLAEAVDFFMFSAIVDVTLRPDCSSWLVVEVGGFGADSGARALVVARCAAAS